MANYTGLGQGFGQGLQTGAAIGAGIQNRALEKAIAEANLKEKRTDQDIESAQNNIVTIGNLAKDAIAKGAMTREQAAKAFGPMLDAAKNNALRLGEVRGRDTSNLVNLADSIGSVLTSTATPTEAATTEARAKVTGETARVSALADAGVPMESAVRAIPEVQMSVESAEKARTAAVQERQAALAEARLAFDRAQPNSPVGKLVGDYLTYEKALGPDHIGTQAIRDAIIGEAKGDPPTFDNVRGLRQEFTKQSANTLDMAASYQRIQAASKDPSAAGDLAMIFSFMKMLDPTSVVREGEQASAANARGVPETVRNLYNRIITGEKLTPPQRKDFVNQARLQMEAAVRAQKSVDTEFSRLAKQQGVDPKNVVWDATLGVLSGAEAPQKIGTMPDGRTIYRRQDGTSYTE